MVVRMAKGMFRGNGTSLAALIEYGMLGLRIAAQPPRPSETKKGKMVGFDPAQGNRFSTYARAGARKEMQKALAADTPALDFEFEQKVTTLFEDWKDPVPEQHYEPSPEVEERDEDPPLSAGGYKILFRELQRRRPTPPKCRRPLNFWNPPLWAKDQFIRKVRPRNFPKCPRSVSELANLSAYQGTYWTILKAFEKVADEGFEGWADEEFDPVWSDQAEFMVASFFRSHVLKGKQYRLPNDVLRTRWRLGCERLGTRIKFKVNGGLGLFDKKGHRLPDYPSVIDERVTKQEGLWFFRNNGLWQAIPGGPYDKNGTKKNARKRAPTLIPFLCLHPLASIYYMRGTDTLEVFSWRRYRPKERHEMAAAYSEVLPVKLPEGARKELARIAERRYQSACSIARQAIMAEIEKARKEEANKAA
jgi:hypothetical protein